MVFLNVCDFILINQSETKILETQSKIIILFVTGNSDGRSTGDYLVFEGIQSCRNGIGNNRLKVDRFDFLRL